MNITITRNMFRSDGIFGELTSEDKSFYCLTLEHAYPKENGTFEAKVPPGKYTATRYMSPKFGYEVFKLEDVPGHDFIEIHVGNYNQDSEGCILLGKALGWRLGAKERMITWSEQTFKKFMFLQKDVDSFIMTVEE